MEGRTTELLQNMSDLSLQVKSLTASFQTHFSGDIRREKLLEWIDAIFTDHEYERALVARVQGTCEWILQRPGIQEWMAPASNSNSARILWISGYPGFGKTILAAWLTEYLRYTKHDELSYFFCYFGDEKLRQPLNIVRSWISQLIRTNDKALEIVRETYTSKYPKALDLENITHATELDLWLLFKRLNVGLGSLVFMVDGFDECVKEEIDPRNHTLLDARERFLKALEESIEHTNARILIFSRESADLRSRYRRSLHFENSLPPLWLAYRITREDTQNDIGLYTRAIVNDVLHKRTNDLKNDIVARLVEKCDGMFLYLRRIQPRMKSKSTMSAGKLRAIIEDMPRGLDEAYDRDLRTICDLDSEDRERSLSILRWVLYAARPLTVRELAEALLISAKDDEPLDRWLPQDDLPEAWDEDYTDEQIVGICGSLIDIRGGEAGCPIENQTVHFVHFSVKEYLFKTVDIKFPVLVKDYLLEKFRAEEDITKICLRYLCLKDFQQAAHSTTVQFDTRTKKYAFLHYAALYMSTHLSQAQPWSQSVVRLCNALLDPSDSRWLPFSELDGAWAYGSFEKYMEKFRNFYPNPLYYASLLGMYETIMYLLSCGMDVNVTGGPRATPLQAAASSGHMDSVKLLLDHGADIDLMDFTSGFGNALQGAAAFGREGVVNMLLDRGANADLSGGDMGNCIVAAASSLTVNVPEGSVCRIIERLISAGAGIKSANKKDGIALHEAALADSSIVIEILLKNGADINAATNVGMTALHVATRHGKLQATRCLLANGADRDALYGEDLWAALHCAAGQAVEEIISLILDHGADVDSSTMRGLTPLYIAGAHGRDSLVKILLSRGADVNRSNNLGWSTLHRAAERGHEQVVRLLLEYHAVPDSRTEQGYTPLMCAASLGHSSIVELLLDRGADTDAHDCEGNTPLHRAAGRGHKTVVKLLINGGANIHSRDADEQSPLHKAAWHGREKIVKLLFNNGANVQDRDNRGSTALMMAVEGQHDGVVRFLLDHDAEVNAMDNEMTTPLHLGVKTPEISKMLVNHGASVSQRDKYGDTALHAAAAFGQSASVEVLLDAGADVNQGNYVAETALSRSIKDRNIEVIEVLIKAGADPSILDYYGRNCFDWAALLRLDVPLPRPTSSKTKDPSKVTDMYHQGMLFALNKPNRFHDTQIVRTIREADIDDYLLGRLLLFQNRRQDACTVFERGMRRARELGLDYRPPVACDMCDVALPRKGEFDLVYFVCATCTSTDLCSTCMEEYKTTRTLDRDGFELCENHEFLKVPSDGWLDVPVGKVNKEGETEEEWIARLAIIAGDGS